MKKKIIGIFIVTLLIAATVLPVAGTMNERLIPNDPNFNEQWALDNTGQTGGTPDADIDAPEAWDIETGNPDVVIAMIDSGVDYTHPDLNSNLWENENEIPDNGIDDDGNGYVDDYHGYNFFNNNSDLLDNHGHGTSVAGVIGAVSNNGIGIAGVAWNCKLMILKVWNLEILETRVETVCEAVRYAVNNGADVISMSLGFYEQDVTLEEFIQANETTNYANSKGCILVSSAGNDGTDEPLYPAAWKNVLGVAATDDNDERMSVSSDYASNYGDWVDVAAPGVSIYTTAPTYPVVINGMDYILFTGTSFATPHVAGLAALIISRNPTLSQEEIMDIIKTNVDPYDSEYYLGTGRINAYKALTACNVAPEKPETPSGQSSGKPGIEYTFTTSTTDTNGDSVFYMWDWGDGEYSEWLDTNEASHTWEQEDTFSIRVKAKDIYDAESEWSNPLSFSTPKNKPYFNTPFLRFLENHPHLFPILRQLLRL